MNINESTKLKAAVEMMAEALLPLSEEVRNSFLDRLDLFIRAGLAELTEITDGSTPGTRHGRISVHLLGIDEFIAAARRAGES